MSLTRILCILPPSFLTSSLSISRPQPTLCTVPSRPPSSPLPTPMATTFKATSMSTSRHLMMIESLTITGPSKSGYLRPPSKS